MAKKRRSKASSKRPPTGAKKPAKKTAAAGRKKTAKPSVPKAATPTESPGLNFPVVGIGASAGGLDAFKRFFTRMPADSGMAFVLIQHLAPSHESFTVELLAKHTDMPVTAVVDGMSVQPNQVFVIPPNTYLTISGKQLHLTEPITQRGVRVPIDFFFRSLADDQQEWAICIILTGTGSDGTLGLREVKAAGGMVMVQDLESAQFDGMPRSAIATGLVDHVLPIENMPDVLTRYVQHSYVNGSVPPQLPAEATKDPLQSIIALLRVHLKHDFSCYKKGTLTRRVQRRMGLKHVENMTDYAQHLRDNKEEIVALYKDLLIGVTNFFREPEAWRVLEKKVIATLVQSHNVDTPIRVWIPGCATGEEPYSMAMSLIEQMQAAEKSCDIQIFASDIDQDALSFARAAVYPENIAADLSAAQLKQFFIKGEHTYRINKDIRESVVIAEQNLISDPPFSKLDLISCRNLLIYLDSEVQKKIISLFHFALNEPGFLFLGNSETIAAQRDLFQPVSKKWRIYRRVGPARHDKLVFSFGKNENVRPVPETPNTAIQPNRLTTLAQQFMLQRFCPASVLINRKSEVLYLFGPTDLYLQLPTGELDAELSTFAREGLRTKLRASVHQAILDGRPLTVSDARVKRGKSYFPVQITIEPLQAPKEAEGLLLVAFAENGPSSEPRAVPPASDVPFSLAHHAFDTAVDSTSESDVVIRQLEDELHSTRDDLQTTIEELETSNEEFKAANEEVTSINEELQSTNEELETSKEELQSLNEELSTVNNQLEQKVGELEVLNDDLTNLLSSTDIAAIFLDRQFCIKRFTHATTRLLRVIATDIGRPISDITRKFIDNDLISDAEQVLQHLVPLAKEVRTEEGEWYIRRIMPYRTEDNRIDGTVITFTDVSDRIRSERRVQKARLYAESIVETVRHPLVVLDVDLRVQTCNRAFYETFKVSLEETQGQLFYELGNRQWDIPSLRSLLEQILPPDKEDGQPGESKAPRCSNAVVNHEVEHLFERIGRRTMLLDAHAIEHESGAAELILLAIEDITQRRLEQEELRQLNRNLEARVAERAQSHARLASLVASTADAVIAFDLEGRITDWNAGAERLFDYSHNEVIGQQIDILIPSDRANEYKQTVERLQRGATVADFETVQQAKDGQPKNVSLTISLIKTHDGRVSGASAIVRDISDRKRMEQQLAELAEQEHRRIGQELHDSLGQQMSAVGMLASNLLQKLKLQSSPELDRMSQLVQGIEEAKTHVRKLSQGLLPVGIDAEGLMNALRELTAHTEERFDVACIFDCQQPVRVDDSATATHLYRIAKEALNNAVQHAQAQQISVSLRDEDGIKLQIRDDGIGIPDLPTPQGSGIQIMRYRTGLIGGTLSFTATKGGGTVVTCSIRGRKRHVEG